MTRELFKHQMAVIAGLCLLTLGMPLLAQTPGTSGDRTADVATLQKLVSQLKAENEELRSENQVLRRMLTQAPAVVPQGVTTTSRQPEAGAAKSVAGADAQKDTGYWITSSSSKRHNKTCRYYQNSNGRPCGPNDGVACKICGG